jgi:hypothetical protein
MGLILGSVACSELEPLTDAEAQSSKSDNEQRAFQKPPTVSTISELFLDTASFSPEELGTGFSACAQIQSQTTFEGVVLPWPDDLKTFVELHLNQFPDEELLRKSLNGIFLAPGKFLQYEEATGGTVSGLMCDTDERGNFIFLNYEAFYTDRLKLGDVDQWHDIVGVIKKHILTSHGDQLIFTLVHEIFHAIDHARYLNEPSRKEERNSATQLSWDEGQKSKFGDQEIFALRNKGAKLSCIHGFHLADETPDNLMKSYKRLAEETNFISPYASTNPYEDFADTLATYYFLRNYRDGLIREVYKENLITENSKDRTLLYKFDTSQILKTSQMQRTKMCKLVNLVFTDTQCESWLQSQSISK